MTVGVFVFIGGCSLRESVKLLLQYAGRQQWFDTTSPHQNLWKCYQRGQGIGLKNQLWVLNSPHFHHFCVDTELVTGPFAKRQLRSSILLLRSIIKKRVYNVGVALLAVNQLLILLGWFDSISSHQNLQWRLSSNWESRRLKIFVLMVQIHQLPPALRECVRVAMYRSAKSFEG